MVKYSPVVDIPSDDAPDTPRMSDDEGVHGSTGSASIGLHMDSDAESTMPSDGPSQETIAQVANAFQSCFEPDDTGESSDDGTVIVQRLRAAMTNL